MCTLRLLTIVAAFTAGIAEVSAQSSAPNSARDRSAPTNPSGMMGGFTPVNPPSQSQSAAAVATAGNSPINNLDLPATDPGYHLSNGDAIAIIVWGEGEVSTDQRIDNKGIVRIPLVGDVALTTKTVREAERYLEQLFVANKLLRKPMVSISVRDYATREVSVLGAVNNPGKYRMPQEAASVEIVDLITALQGFRPTARSNEVKVTRIDESGRETVHEVNVESMITGRGAGKDTPKSFLIYPGDRIYVSERLY